MSPKSVRVFVYSPVRWCSEDVAILTFPNFVSSVRIPSLAPTLSPELSTALPGHAVGDKAAGVRWQAVRRAALRQFFAGSFSHTATKMKVAIGPSSSESRNQFKPLRFFPWASPALIRERVPQPTAYSGVLPIGIE